MDDPILLMAWMTGLVCTLLGVMDYSYTMIILGIAFIGIPNVAYAALPTLTDEEVKERNLDQELSALGDRYAAMSEPDWERFEKEVETTIKTGRAPLAPPPKPRLSANIAGQCHCGEHQSAFAREREQTAS